MRIARRSSRRELERTLLQNGLECVVAFLKRVQNLVSHVDISFDEIQAAARALRHDAISEIWQEKGFDTFGYRLSVPVEGRSLSADASAIIAALPEQEQVHRLLEEIAAFLVSKSQRDPETQPAAVTTEAAVRAATKRGKPGRLKQKPETEEYRSVEQLLRELNEDDRIKRLNFFVTKDDLIHIVRSTRTQFHRFETKERGFSTAESARIWDELRKPKAELVEAIVGYKTR